MGRGKQQTIPHTTKDGRGSVPTAVNDLLVSSSTTIMGA
jgi:hypothetical protein